MFSLFLVMKLFSLIVIDDCMPPPPPRRQDILLHYQNVSTICFFVSFLKLLFYVRGLDCKTSGLLFGDVKSFFFFFLFTFRSNSVVNLLKSVQTISIIVCNSWLYLWQKMFILKILEFTKSIWMTLNASDTEAQLHKLLSNTNITE